MTLNALDATRLAILLETVVRGKIRTSLRILGQGQVTEEEEEMTEAEVEDTVIETEETVEDQTLALLPEEEIEDAEDLTPETEREEAPAMTEEETRVTPEAEPRALEEASHLEER